MGWLTHWLTRWLTRWLTNSSRSLPQPDTGRTIGEANEPLWSTTKKWSRVTRYMARHNFMDMTEDAMGAIVVAKARKFVSLMVGWHNNAVKKTGAFSFFLGGVFVGFDGGCCLGLLPACACVSNSPPNHPQIRHTGECRQRIRDIEKEAADRLGMDRTELEGAAAELARPAAARAAPRSETAIEERERKLVGGGLFCGLKPGTLTFQRSQACWLTPPHTSHPSTSGGLCPEGFGVGEPDYRAIHHVPRQRPPKS